MVVAIVAGVAQAGGPAGGIGFPRGWGTSFVPPVIGRGVAPAVPSPWIAPSVPPTALLQAYPPNHRGEILRQLERHGALGRAGDRNGRSGATSPTGR